MTLSRLVGCAVLHFHIVWLTGKSFVTLDYSLNLLYLPVYLLEFPLSDHLEPLSPRFFLLLFDLTDVFADGDLLLEILDLFLMLMPKNLLVLG